MRLARQREILICELNTAEWYFKFLTSFFLLLFSYFSPTNRTGFGHRCTEAFKAGLEMTHTEDFIQIESQGGNAQTLISK